MSSREPDGRPANWTARVFASLALAATALIVLAIVSGSLGGADSEQDDGDRQREATTATGCEPSAADAVEEGFYVLEPGEDLSVVAAKTCVETEALLELNPNLDPQQLPINACIDLVPDGCKALAEG